MNTKILFFVLSLLIFTNCSKKVDLYYPLKDKSNWTYKMEVQQESKAPLPDAKLMVTNLDTVTKNQQVWTPQKVALFDTRQGREKSDESGIMFLAEDNEGLFVFPDDPRDDANFSTKYYLVKYPVYEGEVWKNEFSKSNISTTSTVESIEDTVTVPAGTFNNCVKIGVVVNDKDEKIPVNLASGYIWFAPKVGIVKLSYQSPMAFREKIKSANFQLEFYGK